MSGVGFGDPVAARPVAVPGLFTLQFLEKAPVLLVVAVSLAQQSAVLLAELSAHLGEPVIGDGVACQDGQAVAEDEAIGVASGLPHDDRQVQDG